MLLNLFSEGNIILNFNHVNSYNIGGSHFGEPILPHGRWCW